MGEILPVQQSLSKPQSKFEIIPVIVLFLLPGNAIEDDGRE
jgi:hypothetical protein